MDRILTAIRSHAGIFFVACMAVGIGISRIPFLYEPNGNVALAPYIGTWALIGFLAGMLLPNRPWRWAVAMVLPLPFLAVILDPHPREALFNELVTLPVLPFAAAPIVAGAYGGRAIARHRESAQSFVLGRGTFLLILSAVIGILTMYLFDWYQATRDYDPAELVWETVALGSFGIFAFLFGLLEPREPPWPWPLVMMYVHYFSGFVIMDHWGQIPPFELIYIGLVALPCVALGYLGVFLRRRLSRT